MKQINHETMQEIIEVQDKVDALYKEANETFDKAFDSYLNNETNVEPENCPEYKHKIEIAVFWLHKFYDMIGGSKNIKLFKELTDTYRKHCM